MLITESFEKYLERYAKNISKNIGDDFSYAELVANFTKVEPTGLIQNYTQESLLFPWLTAFEFVVRKIIAITEHPIIDLKFEKNVVLAEKAKRVRNDDMVLTTMHGEFWKLKGDDYDPEKVFTELIEDNLAIYENKFIVKLIDKMVLLLSAAINFINYLIKNLDRNFIGNTVPIGDVEVIQDISDHKALKLKDSQLIHNPKRKDMRFKLLTTSDSPYASLLKRLLEARSALNHILAGDFYRTIKKAKPLRDSDVHMTNVLASNKNYAPCYRFYRKLLRIRRYSMIDEVINEGNYQQYVLVNLFAALDQLGFVDGTNKNKLLVRNGLMVMVNYHLVRGDLNCYITTKNKDHIDLYFALKNKKDKKFSVDDKFVNSISIDLVPSTNEEYANAEELNFYNEKKIKSRIQNGFINSFVVTAVDDTQKNNVIICSPYTCKVDANLRSMIESCLIFAEGDSYIYSHVCPVCGYYVDGEQDDGNCYCPNCDSVYAVLEKGYRNRAKESVWIKRLRNPEDI